MGGGGGFFVYLKKIPVNHDDYLRHTQRGEGEEVGGGGRDRRRGVGGEIP